MKATPENAKALREAVFSSIEEGGKHFVSDDVDIAILRALERGAIDTKLSDEKIFLKAVELVNIAKRLGLMAISYEIGELRRMLKERGFCVE